MRVAGRVCGECLTGGHLLQQALCSGGEAGVRRRRGRGQGAGGEEGAYPGATQRARAAAREIHRLRDG